MNQQTSKQHSVKGKLVVFNGSGIQLEIREHVVPALKSGEICVRNLFTTLCGSDLHTYKGLRKECCPTVLGHEIVGEIAALDIHHPRVDANGEELNVGDVVTWSIFASDPASAFSQRGIPQKGDRLFKYGHALVSGDDVFHGGLAEYCMLRRDTLVLKVPQGLPLPIAATVNCAGATVAGAIRLAGDLSGKRVLITGMGLLGMYAAAMSREAGAAWIGATDLSDDRLAESVGFGVHQVFNSADWISKDLAAIKALLPGGGVDIVLDMSGSPEAMEHGVALLDVGGTAVWIGAVFKMRPVNLDPEQIIRRLITIKGLHNYNYQDIKQALEFLTVSWKRYPFETVVEQEFPLAEAESAFHYAISHRPLRVGVRITDY